MYDTILLTLDVSATDRPIIEHVKQLAATMGSRVVLLRVAASPSAKFHGDAAGGEEVARSRAYLDQVQAEFAAAGLQATGELAYGDPAEEIVRWVTDKGCDLLAMGTHGHKLLADLVLGTTASRVQHNLSVPVLLLRAK
jgi:nucleotide-binding universal stress UspA family protein